MRFNSSAFGQQLFSGLSELLTGNDPLKAQQQRIAQQAALDLKQAQSKRADQEMGLSERRMDLMEEELNFKRDLASQPKPTPEKGVNRAALSKEMGSQIESLNERIQSHPAYDKYNEMKTNMASDEVEYNLWPDRDKLPADRAKEEKELQEFFKNNPDFARFVKRRDNLEKRRYELFDVPGASQSVSDTDSGVDKNGLPIPQAASLGADDIPAIESQIDELIANAKDPSLANKSKMILKKLKDTGNYSAQNLKSYSDALQRKVGVDPNTQSTLAGSNQTIPPSDSLEGQHEEEMNRKIAMIDSEKKIYSKGKKRRILERIAKDDPKTFARLIETGRITKTSEQVQNLISGIYTRLDKEEESSLSDKVGSLFTGIKESLMPNQLKVDPEIKSLVSRFHRLDQLSPASKARTIQRQFKMFLATPGNEKKLAQSLNHLDPKIQSFAQKALIESGFDLSQIRKSR